MLVINGARSLLRSLDAKLSDYLSSNISPVKLLGISIGMGKLIECDAMLWEKKNLDSTDIVNFFCKEFEDGEFPESKWCFRGQSNACWPLTSSLERYCADFGFALEKAQQVESFLIKDFSRHFAAYASEVPSIDTSFNIPLQETLALMQHHGTPTRLMDWTYSFFIALFFALETGKGSSAVWALNTEWIEEEAQRVAPNRLCEYQEKRDDDTFERLFMSKPPKKFIATVNPQVLNKRLSVQQGLFLAVGDVTQSFKKILEDAPGDTRHQSKPFKKIIIAEDIGRKLLKLLYHRGISRASLYPGLDGFASSLKTKAHALRKQICEGKA